MHGRNEFKSDFPPLTNEGYADQLKDNRAVKGVEKKRVFTLF